MGVNQGTLVSLGALVENSHAFTGEDVEMNPSGIVLHTSNWVGLPDSVSNLAWAQSWTRPSGAYVTWAVGSIINRYACRLGAMMKWMAIPDHAMVSTP